MHAIFMLYGKKECVEYLIRDLAAQKLPLRCYKEGEPDNSIYIECQIRILPFGVYEFVFPKEYVNEVLTSLDFHKASPYDLEKEISVFRLKIKPLDYLKKFLKIENIPEFKTDKKLIWWDQHVSFIPLGVRYDGEIEEKDGWKHEAI